MSTAILHTPPPAAEVRRAAIVRRFAWKEFRMLRSLWLAVLVLAACVQGSAIAFSPAQSDQATVMFCLALGAAVLYAVGAASTIFSVEHEEETHSFLVSLPVTWWPLFLGKLAVVTASAVALGVVSAIFGWAICGFRVPGGRDAPLALGVLGVAVLEGFAWGTLFSLLVKRPLVAAILTVVVGAVALNLLVNLSSSAPVASLNPAEYLAAAPLRLAVAAILLFCSAAIAKQWLVARPTTGRTELPTAGLWHSLRMRVASWFNFSSPGAIHASRRTMLAHLLWQTWRDANKQLAVPVGVALFLCIAISAAILVAARIGNSGEAVAAVVVCTVFFVPALYGAMAFSADQRRQNYRFLAEHAARPRYVWLARHVVWLGTLVTVAIALYLAIIPLFAWVFNYFAAYTVENYLRWGQRAPELRYDFIADTRSIIQGTTLACLGGLAAYSLGQLCSMLMRSEIMAAFLALVLSVFLSVWVAVLFAWELSGWVFLMPMAAGLMLATWLRAPDWIAGRNTWRSWVKPATTVVMTFALLAALLPVVRLGQLPANPDPVSTAAPPSEGAKEFLAAARETAEDYIQVAERLAAGPKENLLARWESPGREWTPGGFLEREIPADEMDEFREAEKKQLELIRTLHSEAVAEAIKISKRPACQFEFTADMLPRQPKSGTPPTTRTVHSLYEKVMGLQTSVLFAPQNERWLVVGANESSPIESEKYKFMERTMAVLRMSAHMAANQPSAIWLDQMQQARQILGYISQWAVDESRTQEELQAAQEQLSTYFRLWGSLQGALLADDRLVRDALTGKAPPLVLEEEPDSFAIQMAIMANELSWERTRALEALDLITRQNLGDADQFGQVVIDDNRRERGNTQIRRWLRPTKWMGPRRVPDRWALAQPAAATSYLTRFEYSARTPVHDMYRAYCDAETCRRAAILQIALAMYRLDHGQYPNWLNELVPDYLEALPLDPYSSQPFQYVARGLDRPLVPWSNQGNFQQVDSGTPFLWSVGAGNARLKQWDRQQLDPNVANPEDPAVQITDLVYILQVEDEDWWGEASLVFPLATQP